ncbi:metallophosphoesterase [Roseisolibacter sp. H3M3-2]|uniref:metallophosphoesterase n=1 Tax=Roseisolibacter sp. H3M3-2 TaxID=3031323 RepID=UPI0023DA2C74|nr:metallophosphoesterase [Roseisolibacter sp. H3M3-2]MDF1501710.1 metallophosphoesterase [Roseisolibacter sp. H3M3-2]
MRSDPPPPPPEPLARTTDVTPPEPVRAHVLGGPPPSRPADPPPAPPAPPIVDVPPVVEVETLDWDALRRAAADAAVRARADAALGACEATLDAGGLLFDADRASPDDRAVHVRALDDAPLWFVGDLHGDLLALEAALALVGDDASARLVLLGDLWDDGGHPVEVLLRVFELVAERPGRVCLVAGNHDEALRWTGERFAASVSPSDFAEWLDAHPEDATARRAARLAIRLAERAPRALFLPDGLLVAHGGFPLVDLHAELEAGGDFNDPRALADFVWTRAHPKARRKLPNRASRGSQWGHEDFADFCALAARLGRPVTHMVRGHDHVEERWAVYRAGTPHPVLTTVALSRRLPREAFGPYARVPTVARWVRGALPQVHRLHVPADAVRALYPEPPPEDDTEGAAEGGA